MTHDIERDIIKEHYRSTSTFKVWGIPRGGGYVAAIMTGAGVRADGFSFQAVDDPANATCAVDDIIDTGQTAAHVLREHGLKTYALVDKIRYPERWAQDEWIVFPWEGETGKEDDCVTVVTRMLQIIGEDAKREGLQETPQRVVRAWEELYEGNKYSKLDLTAMLKTFDNSDLSEQPVTLRGISFTSMCEHHMMPYHGTVTVSYTPGYGVIGLSKIPRVVRLLARRLTLQERLTQDIIDVLRPVVVSACVEVTATHTCLSDRGVQDPDVWATTVAHC